jgi:gluconolactonase
VLIASLLLMNVISDPQSSTNFLAQDSQVVKLPKEFMFTEGPVWTKRRTLLFTDIPANRIYEWDGKAVKVFREPSRNANGLTIDRKGNLYMCEHSGRVMSQLAPDGTYTELAKLFQGKKFNSPNDLAIHPKSGVFAFSDPSYGLGRQPSEIGFRGVFLFNPKDGSITEFMKGKDQPNGVVFSAKGDFLYVADSGAGILQKFAYDGKPAGEPLWTVDAPSADGIRVDLKGNVWAACTDGVRVYSPDGKVLATIKFPEQPANLCFGGRGSTLYVTARKGVYSVELKVKGVMPGF